MLLRVRVEDAPLRLARLGERHVVGGVRPAQEPRDHAVLALPDRLGGGLAAHRAVHGLDGHLSRERGGVRLPRGDLTLPRLTRGRGRVEGLADGLEDRLDGQSQEGADAGGGRRAQVGHVVDLVGVQTDGLHEVHLDLVARRDAAHDLVAGGADVLGHRDDRRDIVARVRVLRREERVVEVEFAHGHAVRPRRPLGRDAAGLVGAEDGRTVTPRGHGVREGLGPGGHDGAAVERGGRDGCVVDHAVDDHVDDLGSHLDRIGRDLGDGPGELALPLEVL
jgi:hypothetical protein